MSAVRMQLTTDEELLEVYRVAIIYGLVRQEKYGLKALIGRITSGFFWDQWTYHFLPPFFPSESDILTFFALLVRP